MESFVKRATVVQLKSELNLYYLVADDDEVTISLAKSPSNNSRWYVEFVDNKPGVIRLLSCSTNKYLSVSIDLFSRHGVTEKQVGQFSSQPRSDISVDWIPNRTSSGSNCVSLSTPLGSYLRPNNNRDSIALVPSSQFHVVGLIWNVDVLEFGFLELKASYPPVMKIFIRRAKIVQLKNECHQTYLVADEDGETISQSRYSDTQNLRWCVQFMDMKPEVITLKNCETGKYLGAYNRHPIQCSNSTTLDSLIEWFPQAAMMGFKLRTRAGTFLQAKENSMSLLHALVVPPGYYVDGIIWSLDVLEFYEVSTSDSMEMHDSSGSQSVGSISFKRGSMSIQKSAVTVCLGKDSQKNDPLSLVSAKTHWPKKIAKTTDPLSPVYVEIKKPRMERQLKMDSHKLDPWFFTNKGPSNFKGKNQFSILATQLKHTGPLNSNRWNILALVIKAMFRLRLLLREAYASQEKMKLHCCLFPRDYTFERDTMVQLWMAAGYLRNKRMEESGRRYFEILLSKEHIISSGIDTFSGESKYATNFDNTFSVPIKEEDIYMILKEELPGTESTQSFHVSLVSDDINQTTFETLKRLSELRTLLFVHNYGSSLKQLPSEIFLALPCLEALDLSGSHISELPRSVGNLSQLRYLDLSFTLIESLPETIGRLQKLQTLKLEGCKQLYDFPKGFGKLVNLRHLYFDILGQLSCMPRGIGALVELRTLSAFIVDILNGCNIRELRFMNNLNGNFCISGLEHVMVGDAKEAALHDKVNLTRLQLNWNGYGVNVIGAEYLEPHFCLEQLEILGYPRSTFPKWICDEKFKQLNCITFRKCEVSRLDLCLGKLPNLKCLDLIQMDRVKRIDWLIHVSRGQVSFSRLEKLTIDGMCSLVSWTGVESGDFPLLSQITVKNCPKLHSIRFLPFLISLKHLEIGNCPMLKSLANKKLSDKLETLMVDDCPLLNERHTREGDDWDKIKHAPHIWFDLEDMHSTPLDSAVARVLNRSKVEGMAAKLSQTKMDNACTTDSDAYYNTKITSNSEAEVEDCG